MTTLLKKRDKKSTKEFGVPEKSENGVHVAISQDSRKKLSQVLSLLLADTYALYVKTQNFHWNVTGPQFPSYHKLFEEQYIALSNANDEIAERIRALHARTPGSLTQFLKLTSLEEADNNLDAEKMAHELMLDHEQVAKSLGSLFKIAQDSHDDVTLDLFIRRKTEHDKFAWMLRSTSSIE